MAAKRSACAGPLGHGTFPPGSLRSDDPAPGTLSSGTLHYGIRRSGALNRGALPDVTLGSGTIRIGALVSLVVLLLSLVASAQPQAINITRRIGFDSIPAFVRIQAAATSGASTLVAWGAADEASGETVGRLYYRVARANDSGRTRLLVDTSFRPAHAVAVAPVGSGFIVVWGDRRSEAVGLYAQRVTLDGAIAGAPSRLHSSTAEIASLEALVTGSGTTLIWTDSLGELFVHRFAHDGTTLIDGISLGRRAAGSVRRLAGIPDLIEIPTAAGARVIDGANRIRPLSPSLRDAFEHGHMMLPDSSVAILRDSTVYLYRSAFSDDLLDSVTIPIPASSLPLSALGISADSTVQIGYPVISHLSLGWKRLQVEFTAWSWRRGSAPQRRIAASYDINAGPSQEYDDISLRSAKAMRLCGNRTLITVVARYSTWIRPGYIFRDGVGYFLMWPSGAVTVESQFAVPVDDCQYDDSTRPLPLVLRTEGPRGTSRVIVTGDTFSAPTRRFQRNVGELEPNVILDRGRVSVSFRSLWRNGVVGVIAWDAAGADSAHDAPPPKLTAGRSFDEQYRRYYGASILERCESWVGTLPGEPYHGSHAVVAIGARWPMLFELADSYGSGMLPMALGVSAAGSDAAGYYAVPLSTPVARSGPIEGPVRWTRSVADAITYKLAVYLDTARMLLLSPRGAPGFFARIVSAGVAAVDTFAVNGDVDSIMTALPIDADRYFLVSFRRADESIVVREMRLRGGAISVTSVPAPATLRDRYFLLDPADATVAIVAASDSGVHIARFSRGAGATARWTLLYPGPHLAQPSARFLGDTLYAAWADTASTDIMGIAVHRTALWQYPNPQRPAPGTFATSPVWPTPAQERATLRIDVPEAGILSVYLFDSRGRLVRTIARDAAAAGWLEVTIDVSDLIDGVYELRASAGGKEGFARISVVHDR